MLNLVTLKKIETDIIQLEQFLFWANKNKKFANEEQFTNLWITVMKILLELVSDQIAAGFDDYKNSAMAAVISQLMTFEFKNIVWQNEPVKAFLKDRIKKSEESEQQAVHGQFDKKALMDYLVCLKKNTRMNENEYAQTSMMISFISAMMVDKEIEDGDERGV